MAGPTLPDCRLPKLRRHHRATAGPAQTRTYPRQRSSTGSRFPYRFRRDTGPCVGTGEGLANSGKEIRDSKAAPQQGELRTNLRSCQKGGSCFGCYQTAIAGLRRCYIPPAMGRSLRLKSSPSTRTIRSNTSAKAKVLASTALSMSDTCCFTRQHLTWLAPSVWEKELFCSAALWCNDSGRVTGGSYDRHLSGALECPCDSMVPLVLR